MKKKQQAFQADSGFDSFDSVSVSDADSGFNSFDSTPASGSDSEFDFPAGPADDGMGSSFEDFTPPPQSRRSSGRSPLLPVLAVVMALVLGAAAFLLIPRNTDQNTVSGTASPTGKTAFLSPGCERLLNEILLTADPALSRKQIEEELAKLDGAIVGYLPALNQYQIRFNTDSQKGLDEKKEAMEALGGVVCADYNYVLTLSVSQADSRSYTLPELWKNTLGLLGGLPPQSADAPFLLASSSAAGDSVPEEELPAWLSGRRDSIVSSCRADQAASLLNQSESQLFASCFFFMENKDGTVSGYTTTSALRFQLYRLAGVGADTVAFPFEGPRIINGNVPQEEIELNERFFAALEKSHPSFLLCKAWKEQDFLITAFSPLMPESATWSPSPPAPKKQSPCWMPLQPEYRSISLKPPPAVRIWRYARKTRRSPSCWPPHSSPPFAQTGKARRPMN